MLNIKLIDTFALNISFISIGKLFNIQRFLPSIDIEDGVVDAIPDITPNIAATAKTITLPAPLDIMPNTSSPENTDTTLIITSIAVIPKVLKTYEVEAKYLLNSLFSKV